MTAIAELRKKAAEKFDGYTLELETGTVVLKSLLSMDEKETAAFNKAQKSLVELDDETTDVEVLRKQFVDCLVSVAADKRQARKLLSGESIAFLMVVFEDYGATLAEATKSEGAE
jgi:septation ring formation regulator EzrA